MANPLKGEVALPVGDATFKIRLTIDGLIQAEDLLDMSTLEIAAEFAKGYRVKTRVVRGVLWAGLQDHHPGVDLKKVDDIMGKVGLIVTIQAVTEAIQKSFPPAEGTDRPPANPAEKSGTGKTSSPASQRRTRKTRTASGA